LQSLIKANTALSAANFGSAILNVTYGGAAAPTTAAANDNLNVTNYTLLGCTGALSPGLANDKGAIAGTGGKGYGRAVTVTGSFKAAPSNVNFAYPLYMSNIAASNGLNGGVMSLYLPAFGLKSGGTSFFTGSPASAQGQKLNTYTTGTAATIAFVTAAISPVGFSQFVADTTTVGTQTAIVIRVNHATTTTGQIGNAADQQLNGSSTTTWLASSDRDQARTATIPGITLDQGSTFLFNSTVVGAATAPGLPANINRSSGLNVRLIAQYSTGTLNGVPEDVTNLFGTQFGVRAASGSSATAICFDFVDNGAATIFNLNDTAGFPLRSTAAFVANAAGAPAVTGLTRGQVLVTSNQTAVANQNLIVGAKYPHTGAGQGGTAGNADKAGTILVNVP